MLKKAMIMAAGVGSRLGALSAIVPKPLVPVANIPAMDILIKHLTTFGIRDIVANTHYKTEQIIEHYSKKNDYNISFVNENELSGTAGGVGKCKYFFDKDNDFVVMSGDGLTDIDLNKAYESHKESGAIATIILKNIDKNETSKYGIVVPDKEGFVESFQEKPAIDKAKSTLANTGIYIFNYRIFDYIPENTFYDFAKNVFPELMRSNEKINTFETEGYWSDVGSIEQYKQSNIDIINKKMFVENIVITKTENSKCIISEDLIQGENCIFENSVIGKNCIIGNNCSIINSVIWDNVTIEPGSEIKNCIVLSGAKNVKTCENVIIDL